ncbi:MAG: DNRLRE domain-containing protein [Pedosphaera sp.]|nr:DNRLRE domain-containing protein [Pedosphaera sp.]
MNGPSKIFLPLALAGFAIRVGAASLTNNSAADTTLLEIEPSHNNGGQSFVIAGHIQNPYRTRGLYRFDFTALPTNTLIRSVVLELTVTRQPGETPVNSPFGLHRMLRPWGEGNKIAVTFPGQGVPATAGEATWSHSFYPTNVWTSAGGEPDVDFFAAESSFQFIYGSGSTYRFESTPEFVDDVQFWVNHPPANFGWMLISDDEATPFTARHFGSREDPDAHPNLELDFLVPPRFDSAQRVGDQFQMRFTPWPGQSYTVQFRTNLSNATWQTLTNVGLATSATQILVNDTATAAPRFYRLSSY